MLNLDQITKEKRAKIVVTLAALAGMSGVKRLIPWNAVSALKHSLRRGEHKYCRIIELLGIYLDNG